MRIIPLLLLLLASALPAKMPAFAAPQRASSAMPATYPARFVLCDNFCALVDARGKLVTHRVFEKLDPFVGAHAIYQHRGTFGAINRAGETVVRPVHAGLRVLGGNLLLAEDPDDQKRRLFTLYDEAGHVLLTVRGDDVTFGYWGGHPYYKNHCSNGAALPCTTTFLDQTGQSIATYGAFQESPSDGLAVASIDGKRFGYVDRTLRFVIPPVFQAASAFSRDVARISTADGQGLIDRRGKVIVRPGKYRLLFPWDGTPLINAFTWEDRNCGRYLRQDGKQLPLPKGVCPDSSESLLSLGYAIVRDSAGNRGTIDGNGKLRMRPAYPWLRGINSRYLAFGDDPSRPTAFGIVDARGKTILMPQPAMIGTWSPGCCSNPGLLRDMFLARTPAGIGLIDRDGKWRVPARYRDAQVLSADLVAFRNDKNRYELYSGIGEPIALTSDEQFQWVGTSQATPAGFVTFVHRTEQGAVLTGLADASGRVHIPPAFTSIDDAGEGRWAVKVRDKGSDLFALYDRAGTPVSAPKFRELQAPFVDGVTVARASNYTAELIDTQGTTLASFAALFPELARRGDGDDRVEQALDVCFDADPAAEPGDAQPARGAIGVICASPALRERSRAVEAGYHQAQAGDCPPDRFLAPRSAYDGAIADCTTEPCVLGAMHGFERAIRATAQSCAQPVPAIASATVPKPLRARLAQRILATEKGDAVADAETLTFSAFSLGGHPAILAMGSSGASNGPFWLFLQTTKKEGWSAVLADDAGYLRPIEAMSAIQKGLPVLRTQQHVSCCEHAVTFFAYDGRRYRAIESCTQWYDRDERPLLFCEDRKSSR